MRQNNHPIEHGSSGTRILEIGETALFKMGYPERTDFFLATWHDGYGKHWNPPLLGPMTLVRIFRRVWERQYELVVLHPTHYPCWHPRSFLAAFKFTVLRGHPLRFPAVLFSTFAFVLLRFLPRCPLVVVDMSDSFGIPRHHIPVLDRARFFFKRELPVDKWQVFYRTGHRSLPTRNFRHRKRWRRRLTKILPIAIAILPQQLSRAQSHYGSAKQNDVFFVGQTADTSTVREVGIQQLRNLAAKGVKLDIPNQPLQPDEFHRRCSQAWLTWSPSGFGWDCMRHAEASVAGSVPVINSPTINRYRPMRHGKHCFYYFPDEEGGLERVILEALSDKKHLTAMASAARKHVLKYHRVTALCDHIIAMMNSDGKSQA